MSEPANMEQLATNVARTVATRFWLVEIWSRLVGRKVKFARAVRRGDLTDGGESVTIPAGTVGTVAEPFLDSTGAATMAVLLDNPPPELEPYEGEVHWSEGHVSELEADLEWL